MGVLWRSPFKKYPLHSLDVGVIRILNIPHFLSYYYFFLTRFKKNFKSLLRPEAIRTFQMLNSQLFVVLVWNIGGVRHEERSISTYIENQKQWVALKQLWDSDSYKLKTVGLLYFILWFMYFHHKVTGRPLSGNVRSRLTACLVILSLQTFCISLKPGLFPPVSLLSSNLTHITDLSYCHWSAKVSFAAVPSLVSPVTVNVPFSFRFFGKRTPRL